MTMNLADLASQHCRPLRGAEHLLAAAVVTERLAVLPDWVEHEGGIEKSFRFKNFHETMAFVNALAYIAHREDHHPDLVVSYGSCMVRFNTHDVGGLSENDFVCAAKVEILV